MKPTLDSIASAKAKLAEELRQLEQQEEDLRKEQTGGAFSKVIELLGEFGPNLRYPHSSGITTSKHDHLRELRIQHAGCPYRVLYAFDPRRCAILLLGGDKTGNPRWYDEQVPVADRLYDEHLATLKKEGLLNG